MEAHADDLRPDLDGVKGQGNDKVTTEANDETTGVTETKVRDANVTKVNVIDVNTTDVKVKVKEPEGGEGVGVAGLAAASPLPPPVLGELPPEGAAPVSVTPDPATLQRATPDLTGTPDLTSPDAVIPEPVTLDHVTLDPATSVEPHADEHGPRAHSPGSPASLNSTRTNPISADPAHTDSTSPHEETTINPYEQHSHIDDHEIGVLDLSPSSGDNKFLGADSSSPVRDDPAPSDVSPAPSFPPAPPDGLTDPAPSVHSVLPACDVSNACETQAALAGRPPPLGPRRVSSRPVLHSIAEVAPPTQDGSPDVTTEESRVEPRRPSHDVLRSASASPTTTTTTTATITTTSTSTTTTTNQAAAPPRGRNSMTDLLQAPCSGGESLRDLVAREMVAAGGGLEVSHVLAAVSEALGPVTGEICGSTEKVEGQGHELVCCLGEDQMMPLAHVTAEGKAGG